MIKAIVKLLVVIAIANALWRSASAYLSFYRFQDSVSELATHRGDRTDSQIKDKVAELAASYDEPLDASAITVRREEYHTYIDGTYTKSVALCPGYEYQWPFTLKVDGFVIVPTKASDLTNPK
jgi:hypothetical protein